MDYWRTTFFSDVFLPVSIANEVACKGLDWLEAVFPMLLTTTEQVTCDARCDSQQASRLLIIFFFFKSLPPGGCDCQG